jgi:predicted transcriptional regulator of viral defense system
VKYYEQLISLGSFNYRNVVEITGSEESTNKILRDYIRKGYIEKIRRDYYVAISMETHQPVVNRYQIASNLYDDAYITHHSAFEAYGYANQIFYNVYFTCKKRVTDFSYDGVNYLQTPLNRKSNVVQEGSIWLTSIEQTVVDSIKDYEKIAGLEEVLRCIELIPSLNEDKLLECLLNYNNVYLYQKCGYILENIGKPLGITDSFLKECQQHIGNSKHYLFKNDKSLILDKRWLLYVPPRLRTLVEKGAIGYDEI